MLGDWIAAIERADRVRKPRRFRNERRKSRAGVELTERQRLRKNELQRARRARARANG